MTPFLHLDRLAKSFDGRHRVLDGLTLAIGRGEIVALLGPSGSGKTTALRLIAGFEAPDPGGGRILVEGQDVSGLPPARRNFGMVFQHYALFPHLDVGENVAFGLEGRGGGRAQIASRVAAALALVDLPGFERRRVGEISGGQQQRVALARALAPEPRVLLLDEPLSNLDPALRERTRRELRRAIRRVGITTVLVTHEQEEAFHLGDRVAVLQGGVLQQAGTPEELYDRPATRFVATFVGRASVLPGTFVGAGGSSAGLVRVDGVAAGGGGSAEGGRDAAGAVAWWGAGGLPFAAGEPVELVVRPEALALVAAGGPRGGALAGKVVERRYAGPVTYYEVELAGTGLEVEVLGGPDEAAPGDAVAVGPRLPPPPPGPPPRPGEGAAPPAGGPSAATPAAPAAFHQATAPATGRIFRRPAAGGREGTP
jgi:ABC-type Fe3+/spermidine/putrescine transport system ATPase subunit